MVSKSVRFFSLATICIWAPQSDQLSFVFSQLPIIMRIISHNLQYIVSYRGWGVRWPQNCSAKCLCLNHLASPRPIAFSPFIPPSASLSLCESGLTVCLSVHRSSLTKIAVQIEADFAPHISGFSSRMLNRQPRRRTWPSFATCILRMRARLSSA